MHFTLGLALAVSSALSGSSLETPSLIPQALTIEEYTRDYFSDVPVMAEIAKCESQFRQYNKDGSVLKNPKSTAIGTFQIMSSIHDGEADKLGLDLTTLHGNLEYARHLYEKSGTKPWNASKACWGKSGAGVEHLAVK